MKGTRGSHSPSVLFFWLAFIHVICLMPAYFYLHVRNGICKIILEIICCLESFRLVFVRRTGRLVSPWPSSGIGPSEEKQQLLAGPQLRLRVRGSMWFLPCQHRRLTFLWKTDPDPCLCVISNASNHTFLTISFGFPVGCCH